MWSLETSVQQLKNVDEVIEKLRPYIRDIGYRTYYRKRRETREARGSVLCGYKTKEEYCQSQGKVKTAGSWRLHFRTVCCCGRGYCIDNLSMVCEAYRQSAENLKWQYTLFKVQAVYERQGRKMPCKKIVTWCSSGKKRAASADIYYETIYFADRQKTLLSRR